VVLWDRAFSLPRGAILFLTETTLFFPFFLKVAPLSLQPTRLFKLLSPWASCLSAVVAGCVFFPFVKF